MGKLRRAHSFWVSRYILKHFEKYSDAELAAQAGVTAASIATLLTTRCVQRTPAQEGRIRKRGPLTAPRMFTPRRALTAVTRIETRSLDRRDAVILAAMFVMSLTLYAATAARTVTGEDAGELLAAAHGLGVPHPPGYPLWTLLSAAFDRLLPFGTVAWRVTLVSSLFSALANTVLLAIALKTIRHRVAAWSAVALFAVSLAHWRQAVIPEVYGLNTFLLLGAVLLLLRLAERPTPGRLLALAATCGIALTNHTSALPVAGVLAVGAILVAPRLFRRPGVALAALACGLLPLLLYAYLPWASVQAPYMNWGEPKTWDSLVDHVARIQYAAVESDQLVTSEYGDYLRRLGILARSMGEQFGSAWVLVFAVIGFYALVIRQPALWTVLMLMGWLCSIGITQYSSYSFDREHVYANQIFFIPAWATLAWLVAGGIDAALIAFREARPLLRQRATRALSVIAMLLVALPAARHYQAADRSQTTLIADYGKALLDGMGEGALYFPSSDHSTFAVMYWQGVQGYRTDVVLADKYGRVDQHLVDEFVSAEDAAQFSGLPGSEQRVHLERLLIERWPGPVYFANRRDMADTDRQLEPVGLLFQVVTKEEAERLWQSEDEETPPPGLAAWERLSHLNLDDVAEGRDFTVQMIRGDIRYLRGLAELRAGQAEMAFETWAAIEADLAPLKQLYNNIGSSLADLGRPEDALLFYDRALQEDAQYVLALRNSAIVKREQGDLEGALSALDRVLALKPRARRERLERARIRERVGRPLHALADYERLARLDPKDPVPWNEAGSLLERVGDLDKAQQALTESLRINPRQLAIAENLDRLRQGIRQQPSSSPGATDSLSPALAAEDPFGHEGHAPEANDPLLTSAMPVPPQPQMPGSHLGKTPGAPQLPDPTAGILPNTESPHRGDLP